MKKTIYLILGLLLIIKFDATAQQQVSISEATAAAKQSVTKRTYMKTLSVITPAVYKVNQMQDNNNNTIMYEVVFTDGQAVLLSGSKACLPILGNITHSDLTQSVFDKNVPCGFGFVFLCDNSNNLENK